MDKPEIDKLWKGIFYCVCILLNPKVPENSHRIARLLDVRQTTRPTSSGYGTSRARFNNLHNGHVPYILTRILGLHC